MMIPQKTLLPQKLPANFLGFKRQTSFPSFSRQWSERRPSFRLGPYQGARARMVITTDTMNAIEEYIRWARGVGNPYHFHRGMDTLVRFMALINQGIAQRMAYGAADPQERRPELAWRMPVRRITGRYYVGWKVRRWRKGTWEIYNDSREAYFIEFGISRVGFGGERWVPARRIRRPIRKLSMRKTLDAMMRTHAYHRVWTDLYAPPRLRPSGGRGFTQIVQSPAGGHSMFAPWGSGASNAGNSVGSGPGLGRHLP